MSTIRSLTTTLLLFGCASAFAAELPVVGGEDGSALQERVEAVLDTLAGVDPDQAATLRGAIRAAVEQAVNGADAFARIEDALDAACLVGVNINPESRVKVSPGPAELRLTPQQKRCYLVKVHNMAAVTAPLRVFSDQSLEAGEPETNERWLRVSMLEAPPMPTELTGKAVDYRIICLETEAVGDRSALLAMDVGQGTADIGFRNDVLLTFRCEEPDP